jgi:GMP reductase
MTFQLIPISEIKEVPFKGRVYDLEVKNNHSYNIEGIVVHNSHCSTRKVTGVGYPQVSTARDCSNVAHGLSAGIILDGGMRSSGDIAKAFCANSDMVMIGGMFSGTDEQEGEIITRFYKTNEVEIKIVDPFLSSRIIEYRDKEPEEKKYKLFYGMSSNYAQEQHFGGIKKYRASEGSVEEVPYIGPVQNVINEILGGLRSCGTYIGANSIKNFGKCATFIRVNRQHDKF